MADFPLSFPKAELHLHLEGAVEPETLHELDPSTSLEDLSALYRYENFEGFLHSFASVVKRMNTPADYALVTRRLIERLHSQDVRYAEITIAAGVVLWKEQQFGPIFDAVQAEAARGPVKVAWNIDAVRQFGPEHVRQVAELAAERVGDGVVSFGIGGSEERGPAEWFRDVFKFAKDSGLRLTAHAGEACGPESIRAALAIGAERIGHGVAAAQDPELMAELRERQIPLEVCITSNIVTGVVASFEQHPVRRLFDAGVPITLNTDDPAMFGCTLNGEYELAARQFGFTDAELRTVSENAFRFAFLQ